MPLFKISNGKAKKLSLKNLQKEKDLQKFVEENCEELLGVRFIASEFSTGERHGGRIDTLGIDSGGNPRRKTTVLSIRGCSILIGWLTIKGTLKWRPGRNLAMISRLIGAAPG